MSILRSRPAQAIAVVVLFIVTFYLFFTGEKEFSPEELNSILQNKESSIVNIDKVELTSQGLKAPFLDSGAYKVKHWEMAGNILVKTNDYIRLTSDLPKQVGNMFSQLPIQAESFEMELTFEIKSKNSKNLFGDGMGVWFIDQKSPIGDVFGAQNNFRGLGVFIDTYKNGKRGHFPFVNVMLGDGHTSYRKESDGFESRLAGCSAHSLVNAAAPTKMRLVYIKDGYLSIDFNYNGIHEDWTNCVTLNDVILPRIKYFGLTAETGDLSQSVDIIENKMYGLYKDDGSFVGSVHELQNMIEEQSNAEETKKSGGRNRAFKKDPPKQTRKTLNRLKMAEKRIKERERKLRLEKYGDADATFVRRTVARIWKLVKYTLWLAVAGLAVWVGFIIYRVQKQKKKKTSGLIA